MFKMLTTAFCGVALTATLATGAQAQAKKTPRPSVDLVICLDTSGSMNGLIKSAKVKLWDIVNELGRAKPAPNLRIALYTYGSPQYGAQSGYVRQNLKFTTDLDMVYQKLFALNTSGGKELVARVSKAALDQLQWTKGKNVLRMIFVCGNESAAQDKQFTLQQVAQMAIKRDVIINTIYCQRGSGTSRDADSWQRLASLAEGRYVSINQNRGAVAINTPVDKKIAQLGLELNKTYLWYGREGDVRRRNQIAQDKNAERLGKGVAAGRAASKAGTYYRQSRADLVDRYAAEPKFDLEKVAVKELPKVMQTMTPAQRIAHVNKMKSKRSGLQKQIADLSKQRQQYIREHQRKNQNSAERAFDDAIRGAIRTQAKRKGIAIPK